ncbi:type 1 glutamine amidotransferase [Nesterenkonia ebinurensis]|uniref:type 1 glutamine amidotransferase n=1 Tax=Nesterenkonia ebinurensis TaxID=2608252 RepID=UPI00168AE7EB|nr:type 1 glutamine amidotransferase [Nesterenkonia ebinurensis]
MTEILVIQHEQNVGIDRLGDWLAEAGAQLTIRRPDRGDSVADHVREYDGLIVLGGSAGPQEDQHWPWLPAVRNLQRHAVQDGIPTLNICLGAQLCAVAHGTEVFRRQIPQIGVMQMNRRVEAAADPVFSALPDQFDAVVWHQEQIRSLPEGAVHLVDGTDAPVQAFRLGESSWSVQFHPEPNEQTIRSWAENTKGLVARAGREPDDVVAEFTEKADQIEATFRPLVTAFVNYAMRRPDGHTPQ